MTVVEGLSVSGHTLHELDELLASGRARLDDDVAIGVDTARQAVVAGQLGEEVGLVDGLAVGVLGALEHLDHARAAQLLAVAVGEPAGLGSGVRGQGAGCRLYGLGFRHSCVP